MVFFENTETALFFHRLNRFTAQVIWRDEIITAHLPNSGRMAELLIPFRHVFLTPKPKPNRKTNFDLILVNQNGILVSVDARLPSQIIYRALVNKQLTPFQNYSQIKREALLGHSRVDFFLSLSPTAADRQDYFIEVKSVTKVANNIALFPDAVTSRGKRHLTSLIEAKNRGYKAAIIFVVQRPDAIAFAPDEKIDPEFAQMLRAAVTQGVIPLAYTCYVTRQWITLAQEIPVYV